MILIIFLPKVSFDELQDRVFLRVLLHEFTLFIGRMKLIVGSISGHIVLFLFGVPLHGKNINNK